ncbi:MAG: DUF1217 domain-containing protein [Alphaproteobacteria bacterium]|nr:DUF1217 domain-containing protein [Alphaproteobacteria bacterium]
MVASLTSMSLALSLMPRVSGGFDFANLYAVTGGTPFNAGSVASALEKAETDEARQLDQARKKPEVQRDLARYEKVVREAGSLDDILDDPVARKVFLKANGLGELSAYAGLAKKALASDPGDADSLANRLAGVNGAWLEAVNKYKFYLRGVGVLKTSEAIKEVKDDYVAEVRLDTLDDQIPGLGSAVLFKKIAASLDTPVKILGSALGREVVTTALGLVRQVAVQSLEAQEKAITQRLDPKKLKDPEFVDRLVQRYLIQLNGGTSGVTA